MPYLVMPDKAMLEYVTSEIWWGLSVGAWREGGGTYSSSCSGVGLDSAAVLAVGDGRVLECHAGNDVVALATYGTD